MRSTGFRASSRTSPTCCGSSCCARRRTCSPVLALAPSARPRTRLTTANILRGLTLEQSRSLLDLFTRSAGEMLDERFEHDLVKALFGFDAIVGNYASPYAAGSAYVMLHHAFGEVNGKKGVWGHAIGGMGAITQAMARAARGRGVTIDLDAGVREVIVERDRAVGVVLENGTTIRAKYVAANVNPKLLYTRLVAADALPAGFPRPHPPLEERLRHLPHERGAGPPALLHGVAGRRRSPLLRHHPGAEPRLYGPRVSRCAGAGLEPEADRRDADPLDARRHARARRTSTSRACSASTSRRSCPTENPGTTIATRSPIS